MSTLGKLLTYAGVGLLILWFFTRKKMIQEGTWTQQRGGAYLWLIIAVAIIVGGFLVS